MRKLFFGIVFCLLSWPVLGKELSVVGTVYPIAETDFIEQTQKTLQIKLENGDWARWRARQMAALQVAADRPSPVPGLRPALHTRHWFFDPSFVVPADVRDANGHLLLAAGSRWNPLSRLQWSESLIFFDGDNPQQVAWVIALDQQLKGRDRLILVNGSLSETARHFQQKKENHQKAPRIYFDQEGRLTQRLQITQTPATVTQAGERLEITEVAV